MKKLSFLVLSLISLTACTKPEKAMVEDIQLIDSVFVDSYNVTTIYDPSNVQTINYPEHYDYLFEITMSKDGIVRKDTTKQSSKKININKGDSIYIKRR